MIPIQNYVSTYPVTDETHFVITAYEASFDLPLFCVTFGFSTVDRTGVFVFVHGRDISALVQQLKLTDGHFVFAILKTLADHRVYFKEVFVKNDLENELMSLNHERHIPSCL